MHPSFAVALVSIACGQDPSQPAMQQRPDMARLQATMIIHRVMPPAPARPRWERALAVAGLDTRVGRPAIDQAVAQAQGGYVAWRHAAEDGLLEELRPALQEQPGPTVPARCTPTVIRLWDEGMKFEQDAFAQLVAGIAPADPAVASLAGTVLRGLELLAVVGAEGPASVPELRRTDLLEAALACGAGGSVSAEQLRGMLSTYEEERTRLLRAGAEAAMQSDARRVDVMSVVPAWWERRTTINADPRQDLRRSPGAMPVMMALQNAPQVDVSARMADLQRRTADQLTKVLSPQASWCLYVRLIAAGRTDAPSDRIPALERIANGLPADRRDAGLALVREYCTSDRAAMETYVGLMARTSEDTVAPVRSTLRAGAVRSLTDEQLDAISKALEQRALTQGDFGMVNPVEQRKRATADLEKRIRALAE